MLKKYGYFHFGIPVHDTIGRVISAIEPEQFHDCFIQWMKSAALSTQGEIIAREEEFKEVSHQRHEDVSKGHGRIEERRYWFTEETQ